MALSTEEYGYIIDPMVPFTGPSGTTIRNGYVRVFVAGSSTPVITYKNYDGATNEETIQLDNSGRTAYPVIVSKGNTYKVCVYDAEHSQESPILTIDKVVPAGANVEATNIVTGLNNVESPEAGWVKSTVSGTDAEVSLDATNVTSEVDTMVKATAASADYMMPLVHKTGSEPDKKITLGNIFKFVLNFIHSLTDTAAESDLTSGNYFALDGSAGTKKLNSTTLLTKTAQNALAGNIAPAFVENSTNALAGHLYSWEGKTYVAKEDYNGTWNVSKFEQLSVDELLDGLRNILSFYEQDSHILTSSNTLSNISYANWHTYYKVFVPKGAVVNYKNTNQNLDAGYAYIYIIDLEGNDLYTKLGGAGTGNFDVSYTMPEDGYVSLCGTPRSTIKISVNCPIGHSFEGAYIRKFEAETKAFEADVNQKINSVLQYYTQSVYALTSSNTLSHQSYPTLWATYYKLFVPKGAVVRYKNDGSYLVSGFAYVYIIDLEGNDLYKKLGSSENTPFDITYTMPEDGYVSLCGTPRPAIQISVSCPPSYNYYDKVVMQQVKNDVEGLKDETYLGEEFAAFRKFGVVGDSLSVGYMTDSNNVVNQRNLPYSWGQVLARKNAQVCLNFGKSGITTTTWWTDSVCKDLLVLSENQCQAYIVGIGTNDVINASFPIGSMSDIDWSDYNNNANSFYGHYARILQLILSVAPRAVIFVMTLPYPRVNTEKNTAFRTICADAHLSSNVFLVDLEADYNDLFKTIGDRYANDYHFTAAGYASIATALGVIISETIRKNSSVNAIKDIGFIPFGSNNLIE